MMDVQMAMSSMAKHVKFSSKVDVSQIIISTRMHRYAYGVPRDPKHRHFVHLSPSRALDEALRGQSGCPKRLEDRMGDTPDMSHQQVGNRRW
jgi:hypothetical protein